MADNTHHRCPSLVKPIKTYDSLEVLRIVNTPVQDAVAKAASMTSYYVWSVRPVYLDRLG